MVNYVLLHISPWRQSVNFFLPRLGSIFITTTLCSFKSVNQSVQPTHHLAPVHYWRQEATYARQKINIFVLLSILVWLLKKKLLPRLVLTPQELKEPILPSPIRTRELWAFPPPSVIWQVYVPSLSSVKWSRMNSITPVDTSWAILLGWKGTHTKDEDDSCLAAVGE